MRDFSTTPDYVSFRQGTGDPEKAVAEATAGLDLYETCFVLVFLPVNVDRGGVAAALNRILGGVPIFGCTTAGQVTPDGYQDDTLLLLAFPKANFRCASIIISPLDLVPRAELAADIQRQAQNFPHTARWNRLGLVFTDGVSKREDLLISLLQTVLDDLPVFGGSAGDGLEFGETFVLHHGRFESDAAVLLLVETNLQFQGIGFDHFLPTGAQLVITDADPDKRLVYEINGASAAEEYARLVGCSTEGLSPRIFAENPLLVEHNGQHYVRAISDVTDDGALSFLAAIDDGLIMTLGEGQEIIETLGQGLSIRDPRGCEPDFILAFDCVLRRLEIEQKALGAAVGDVFRQRRVLGFNTYGEQQGGVHMNQTFVGVAFFEPQKGAFD